jgi:hypothetical protein
MTERARLVLLLAFLAAVVGLIAFASLGSTRASAPICVSLGGRPMTDAEANALADQFHYSAGERADLIYCIAHTSISN